MRLKICGLTREADILAANDARPDYIGFVFAESRRRVRAEDAAQMKKLLSSEIQAVGVFVDAPVKQIAALVRQGTIDLVQLHGTEDEAYLAALRRSCSAPIIQAVRVRGAADIVAAGRSTADYLLFDAYSAAAQGGTGERFDWTVLQHVAKPFFLAGGIREEVLEQALQSGAFALDVSSGAETDGKKDPEKMRRLAERIRRNRHE